MSTHNINIQFKVTAVPNNIKRFRTQQNVKKRFADILYVATPPKDGVKLEYVGSTESSPALNMSIADRSDEVYANSQNNTIQEIFGDGNLGNIQVANKNFIITKDFIENSNTVIPLYYKMLLPSTIVPESVKVLDSQSNQLSLGQYKVKKIFSYDEDTGVESTTVEKYYLFNSLENKYNHINGEYSVYYVQYTTNINGTETTITTLLNNELAYKEATWEDFWHLTPGFLKPWSYAYRFITNDFDSIYKIALPSFGSTKYAIKYIEANRISIHLPVDTTDVSPWFPRVNNTGFSLSSNATNSRYTITEFNNQAFNPIAPYKLAVRAKCTKVTDRLLKLPNENIISATSLLYNDLEIKLEQDGEVKYAITNNSSLVGSLVTDYKGDYVFDDDGEPLTWREDLFIGIDSLSGILFLDINILDTYDVYATYTYKEEYYTLSSLPMNPLFDPSLINSIRVVYMVPKNIYNGNIEEQVTSLHWLNVSYHGKIIESNQDVDSGNDNLNFETRLENAFGYAISGILGLEYSLYKSCYADSSQIISSGGSLSVSTTSGFPINGWLRVVDSSNSLRYFKYTEKDSTSFQLSTSSYEFPSGNITINSDTIIELVNFVDEYSLQTRRDFNLEQTYCQADFGSSIQAQYFVLGELSINPPHSPANLARIDVRENGGGLIPDKYEEAKLINPEVQWYSDFGYFNGQPYPGKAVAVVKLPISIKNNFTLEQIKSKVSESIPMGVYPLIRFYGYQPRILSVLPGSNSITVTWEKEGPEFIYNIWYAKTSLPEKQPDYILANKSPIFDGTGLTNNYTISGLTDGTPYIIKITMEDRYYMWWYSYNGVNNIAGGLGLDETTPTPPFDNSINLQFSTA